jgi:hypothetical protein
MFRWKVRGGRWGRQAMLALLASLLFTLSFTLFQYAFWWPVLTEDPTLAWGGIFQGRTFAELAMPMLAFGALLGGVFWPLFLLTPRLLLPPLFAVLWLWQTDETAFVTATASTWQPLEILYAFVLPHVHWLLVTLGPALWLIWSLGRSLLVPAADGR